MVTLAIRGEFLSSRLARTLSATLLLLGGGTLGYSWLEGWTPFDSLYMTVITISTVGFKEVQDLSRPGQMLTLLLIAGGIGVVTYAATNAAGFVLETTGLVARKRMRDGIVKGTDHIVVCGYSKLAKMACDDLLHDRVEVAIIEIDEERAKEAHDEGYRVLLGDATDEETLARAGVGRARGIALLLGSDADNVLAALTVRQLNPGALILGAAESPRNESRLLKAGVDQVINPTRAVGRRIAHAFVRPAAIDLMDMSTRGLDPTIRVREIPIHAESPLCGTALRKSKLREEHEVLVVAVRSPLGEVLYNPGPDTSLVAGSTLVAVGPLQNLRKLHDVGRGAGGGS